MDFQTVRKMKTKNKTDYYNLFVLGCIFFFTGLFTQLYALMGLGFVFIISGFTNKNQWYKNPNSWVNLNKKQKNNIKIILIIILVLLIILRIYF